MKQKRIVTIQDISCFGKCSLTVALPIISAMGIECAVIPTAVLSTHTGGFSNFTFCDLTDEIPKIQKHWKDLDLKFDFIYTGYLGSTKQLEYVSDFFENFRNENTKILVDPVMADNGMLYKNFDKTFVKGMRDLCAKADIIVPNLTEAAFMLEEEFMPPATYNEEYIQNTLKKLCSLGCKTAVLTGVCYENSKQGAVAYNSETGEFSSYFRENIPASYHGTGDVFSSTLSGSLCLGKDMQKSLKIAADYTVECIKRTLGDNEHFYGVKFEDEIPYLVNLLK